MILMSQYKNYVLFFRNDVSVLISLFRPIITHFPSTSLLSLKVVMHLVDLFSLLFVKGFNLLIDSQH